MAISKFYFIFLTALSVTPSLAYAQAPTNLGGLINLFLNILNTLIPLLVGLALVSSLWGAVRYILNAGDATKRKEGSMAMLYGVIALFVMISVWGLVGLLSSTFGVDVRFVPQLPVAR